MKKSILNAWAAMYSESPGDCAPFPSQRAGNDRNVFPTNGSVGQEPRT